MLGKLAIFLALTCALGIGMATGKEQKITLYNTPNCTGGWTGENVTYTSSQRIGAPWNRNTASYYVFGVWKVMVTDGTRNLVITSPSTIHNVTCYSKAEIFRGSGYNASQFRFTSVERVGPGNLTTNQFNFYDRRHFQGMEYVLTNSSYSSNIRVQSFAIFGNVSWIVYPNYGYNGRPVCLEHKETIPGGAFTYNTATSIQVGSVKINPSGNCFGYPRHQTNQENSMLVPEE